MEVMQSDKQTLAECNDLLQPVSVSVPEEVTALQYRRMMRIKVMNRGRRIQIPLNVTIFPPSKMLGNCLLLI